MTKILAWHWIRDDRRLGYGDGRKVVAGETIRLDGPIYLCERGLHASTRILDALQYAPGPVICRVRLRGQVERGDDKAVATERETLWMVDARRVLIVWACECAWEALQRVGNPDPRCVAAVHEVMRQQRSGVRDQAKLDAASDAAWAAAMDAARAAAMDAARAAARAAASDAAWDAERARQSKRLRRLIGLERRGQLDAEIAQLCQAWGVDAMHGGG